MGEPVACVYRAYEGDELVATGRITLDGLPGVGDEVRLNGRRYAVREVAFNDGSHLVTLVARGS